MLLVGGASLLFTVDVVCVEVVFSLVLREYIGGKGGLWLASGLTVELSKFLGNYY